MDEKEFRLRLASLRTAKSVSARDMSLSLGQNASYINNIENGKALPSMGNFFYICDYLGVSPQEFFDTGNQDPEALRSLIGQLKHLDAAQLELLEKLVREILKK